MISIFVVAIFVKGEQFGDHCCFVHPRKRKAKNLRLHYKGNDKLRYFDFTTHLPRFTTTKSSVQCHFDFNNGAVFLCLYISQNSLILITDKKIHSPFRSWKMDVTIIQVSKNFNRHHNFSFSCQEVRFLLIILLAHFIFLSDVQKLSKLIKKICQTQLWPMSDNISFKVDLSRELKVI